MTIYTLSHGSLKLGVSDPGRRNRRLLARYDAALTSGKKAVWQPMPLVFRWCHLQTG